MFLYELGYDAIATVTNVSDESSIAGGVINEARPVLDVYGVTFKPGTRIIDRSWVVWTIASMEEALLLQRILRWMPLGPSPREGAGRRPDPSAAQGNPTEADSGHRFVLIIGELRTLLQEEVASLRARMQALEQAVSLQGRREDEKQH